VGLGIARITLDMMAETEPAWKKEKAEAFLDPSIMSRLEADGFVEAVNKEFQAK
jgi:hypothetical protein